MLKIKDRRCKKRASSKDLMLRHWGTPPPVFAKKRLEHAENKEHEGSKESQERKSLWMLQGEAVLK
jgi:hypothetical protein